MNEELTRPLSSISFSSFSGQWREESNRDCAEGRRGWGNISGSLLWRVLETGWELIPMLGVTP